MRKLLFSTIAIASISMLATSTGIAEPTHNNEVGLYSTPDGYGATGTFVMGLPVEVYLVLTRPADVENGDIPFGVVLGFECTLTFNPVPNSDLFYFGAILPPASIDVGLPKDINQGFLEFIVGIGDDWPVIDESVVLATLTFLNVNPGTTEVTLGPTSVPSIAGEMAFLGEEYSQLRAMYSVGGSHEAPVFIFNGEAVAVEKESFGSVKALFR